MTTTTTVAGDSTPTLSAAVALPRYTFDSSGVEVPAYALRVQAHDWTNERAIGAKLVSLKAGDGGCTFHHTMTPAEARAVACALVDCANALDNPIHRVIVDAGEGIGHE